MSDNRLPEWSTTEKVIKGTIATSVVHIGRVMTPEGYWKTKEFSSQGDAEAWCKAYRW